MPTNTKDSYKDSLENPDTSHLWMEEAKGKVLQVQSELHNIVQATQKQRKEWKNIYNSMDGLLPHDRAYPWQSVYHTRMMRSAVWQILPLISPKEVSFQFEPVGDEDVQLSYLFSPVVSHQFEQEIDGPSVVLEATHQAIMMGTSWIKCPWVTLKRKNKTVWDNPFPEVVAIEDIYVNPTYKSVRHLEMFGQALIHAKTVTKDQLLGMGFDKEKVDRLIAYVPDDKGEYAFSYDMHPNEFSDLKALFTDKHQYKVLERWTIDTVCIYAMSKDGMIILEERENDLGFIPFVNMKYELDPRVNRMYGVGIGQNGYELEELYHDFLNQTMDNIRNDANNMWKVKRGSGIDPRQLISRPNGFVQVKEMTDLEQFPNRGIDLSKFQTLSTLENKFKDSIGVSPIIYGDSRQTETLGETDLVDRNAKSRIDTIRQMIHHSIEELGQMIWEQDKRNIKKLRSINVWDESSDEYYRIKFMSGEVDSFEDENIIELRDGTVITPEGQVLDSKEFRKLNPGIILGLHGDFNLKVDMESTMGTNKAVMIKQIEDMIQGSMQDPTSTIKRDELRKKQLKLQGLPNPSQYFGQESLSIPELSPEQRFGMPDTGNLITQRGFDQSIQRAANPV